VDCVNKLARVSLAVAALIVATFASRASASFQFVPTASFQYATVWLDENFNAAPDADVSVGDAAAITDQNLIANHPLDVDHKAGSTSLNSIFSERGVVGSAVGSAGDPSYGGPDTVMADSLLAVRFDITEAPVIIKFAASGTVRNSSTPFDPIFVAIQAADFFTTIDDLGVTLNPDGTFNAFQSFLMPVGSYVFWAESIIGSDDSTAATSSLSFSFTAPEPASSTLLALPIALICRRRTSRT
jgi:hypothetical protein